MDKRNRFTLLAATAVLTALTYVFTAFVNVRLPIMANGGLVHLGNLPMFICAVIFGKKAGAFAGAVGMAIFDLLSGWVMWAPFTFVVVGLMGFAVGAICEKKRGTAWYALAFGIALVIKIVGYYIAEGIIFGNWIAPVASIPGNVVQVGLAAVITLLIIGRLRVAAERIFKL